VAYVRVQGTSNVLKALSQFEPALAKKIGKDLSDQGRKIVKDAKDEIPQRPGRLYNWRATPPKVARGKRDAKGSIGFTLTRGGSGWPAWESNKVKKSVKSRRSQTVLTISVNEAALNIFALAGTVSDGSGPQGRAFVAGLPAVNKSGKGRLRTGRVLIPAVKKNYKDTRQLIEESIFAGIAEINRRLNNGA